MILLWSRFDMPWPLVIILLLVAVWALLKDAKIKK